MEWIAILVALSFGLLGLVCIFSIIFGLPGTWILIGMALLIEVIDGTYLPVGARQTFNWWLIVSCIGLAGIGELLEFFAGVLGAKHGGGSKKGMLGALIGGMLGAIAGIAIPLPVIGSLIGAFVGTFVGAVAGEMAEENRKFEDTLKPATGATIGKVLGTLSKLPIAMVVWLLLTIAAFR